MIFCQKFLIIFWVYDVLVWKIIYISIFMNSIYVLDKYLYLNRQRIDMYNNSSDVGELLQDVILYCLVYGYIVGGLCFFGVVFNIINVIVWCKQEIKMCINFFLIFFVFVDGLLLFFYFMYVMYFFVVISFSKFIYYFKFGMYLVVICFYEFIVFYIFFNWFIILFVIFCYLGVCYNKIFK